MTSAVPPGTFLGLLLALIPAAIVIAILFRWGSLGVTAIYATARMLVQLLLVGYVLVYLFESDSWTMNAVSLAAERFQAERGRGVDYVAARRTALEPALIPMTNSLLAVGIVALPGMMTGQILSGISPMIAAKYQIVVMTMLFGAAGISAAIYLRLCRLPASD